MRNDPGRFCPAGVNQIAQVPVVVLDVGLPGADRLPFEPKESHVKSNLTLPGELYRRRQGLWAGKCGRRRFHR
jgi:hypothetical protein